MKISIIIPTYNEAEQIAALLQYLWKEGKEELEEIIVCDGGSTDGTRQLAARGGARVVAAPKKGRAAQMNHGATLAAAPCLYFLHADTYPPKGFTAAIAQAIGQGFGSGCFRLQFDHPHWFLRANCWFTRFDVNNFRFGDQSLFVTASVFRAAGGFNEQLLLLEDQEIIKRIRRHTRFRILNSSVVTSARKYTVNGIYRTQAVYFLIYGLYRLGWSQQRLLTTYRSLIRQDKL